MISGYEQAACWQSCAAPLRDDQALRQAVLAAYQDLYQHYFVNLPTINPRLPIEIRAFRRIDQWRVFLLLTPWMLIRAWVPKGNTGFAIPREWSAAERESASYTLLGSVFKLTVLNSQQKVHLAFDCQIGHYLLQSRILSLTPYDSANAVYDAWRQIFQTRNEKLIRQKKASKWQLEISRREFFTKLARFNGLRQARRLAFLVSIRLIKLAVFIPVLSWFILTATPVIDKSVVFQYVAVRKMGVNLAYPSAAIRSTPQIA